jgi:AP-1 complex subunit gamma-1
MFGYDTIRRGVLEQMPAPQIKEEQRVLGEKTTPMKDKRQSRLLKDKNNKKVAKKTESDMLLDLMGGPDVPAADSSAGLNGQQKTADLLADILGGGSSVSNPPAQASSPGPAQSGRDAIMDLFNNGAPQTAHKPAPSFASTDLFSNIGSPSPPTALSSGPPALPAYSKNNLTVTIQISKSGQGASILARFRNTSNFNRLTGVGLQAAVPKNQKLTLQAINRSTLEGGEEATQAMKVVGATGVCESFLLRCVSKTLAFPGRILTNKVPLQTLPAKLRLRLRISYGADDGSPPVTEQVDWSEP